MSVSYLPCNFLMNVRSDDDDDDDDDDDGNM